MVHHILPSNDAVSSARQYG